MPDIRVRAATAGDRDFVVAMLVAAANAPHGTATADQVVSDPRTARYVSGWPRESDISLIAETTAGLPAKAAWLRFFPAHAPAFGYISTMCRNSRSASTRNTGAGGSADG